MMNVRMLFMLLKLTVCVCISAVPVFAQDGAEDIEADLYEEGALESADALDEVAKDAPPANPATSQFDPTLDEKPPAPELMPEPKKAMTKPAAFKKGKGGPKATAKAHAKTNGKIKGKSKFAKLKTSKIKSDHAKKSKKKYGKSARK